MKVTGHKAAIVSSLLATSVALPLTSSAETTVFSGKDAVGDMYGYSSGGIYMDINAFESATKNKSNKEKLAGAYFYGSGSCMWGNGSTNNIEFKATGALPRRVVSSGVVEVTWYNWCNGESYTEDVTFNMDLSAITEETFSNYGTNHYDYGDIKANYHYDYSDSPANASQDSYILSPSFGQATSIYSSVGKSKNHEVQIIKP